MLTDAHCHPTDNGQLSDARIMMCIMSTRLSDFQVVGEWANNSALITPAFGIHPWFSHMLAFKENKTEHYLNVLDPAPTVSEINDLPDIVPIYTFINELEKALNAHPHSVLGEVGLDRLFKLKINGEKSKFSVDIGHQRAVLKAQLEVANKLKKSISVHGVKAAQFLYEDIKQFDCLGAVCLHSYGGSAEFFKNAWKKLKVPVYVSLSMLVNGRTYKLKQLLDVLDESFVLTESDIGRSGDRQVELVAEVLEVLKNHFKWDDESVIERNYKRFVQLELE